VLGQFVSLGDEVVVLIVQGSAAAVELIGAAMNLGQFEQAGLVEIGQPSPLGSGGVELAG